MDITNKVVWIIDLFGIEVWITESILNTWIIMAVLTILAILLRLLFRNPTALPNKWQNAIEAVVEAFENIIRSAAGENFLSLGNWFFMVFIFLLASSIGGIVGLKPPSADWATTFALSLATVIIIQIMGIKRRKGKYLKSFFEPHFLFFPLHLIGELSRPIALSFRLFGNVLSGMILTTLIYNMPLYVRFVIPGVLHFYFDIFSGIIQAYIFCVLSMTFIANAATPPPKSAV